MALAAILGTMGLIAGVDSYQRYLFRSDLERTASLLQKARSSAMNNMGETSHGMYLGSASNLILFRGVNYGALPAYDLKVEKSKTVTYADTCPGRQIVFSQLSGQTTACQIDITDGPRSATITINHEGGINW